MGGGEGLPRVTVVARVWVVVAMIMNLMVAASLPTCFN